MIPDFDQNGHLPAGGHRCTWDEFFSRFRTNHQRACLCEKFAKVLQLARNCGFLAVLVGGSFATAKEDPRDLDLTWITHPDVTKDTVKPECRKLMEDSGEVYGWSMLYLPINHNEEDIDHWARELGLCAKTKAIRGTIFLDL